jgi:hypothetical protein
MWGFGIDVDYGYRADADAYAELFFGGKVANTFKGKGSYWETKRLVVAPRVDFMVPIKNWELGFHTNPLVLVFWDYYKSEKKFGMGQRWYNVELYCSVRFGGGSKK